MKINKMLIAIPAMLAVVLSSCKDDDPTVGIDSSMPAPAEVSYDENELVEFIHRSVLGR